MTRTITGAWVAALCAAVMMMAARTDAAAGKKPAAKAKESITLTGCLHADGGKYMLTDLKGDQAPKGRNWKRRSSPRRRRTSRSCRARLGRS